LTSCTASGAPRRIGRKVHLLFTQPSSGAPSLTTCVDAALEAMRRDGTLDRLEQPWLMDEPGFPELR
jgi:hypothetical protein